MAPKVAIKKIEIQIRFLEGIQTLLGHVWVAIIAGGKGERLYPKSNKAKTKPFVRCGQTGFTFLQLTLKRYLELGVSPDHFVIIVCDEQQEKNARADLDEFAEKTGIKVPAHFRVYDEEMEQSPEVRMPYSATYILEKAEKIVEGMAEVKIPYNSIQQIANNYNYAGAQLEAARIIYRYDAKAIVIGTAADQYIEENDSFCHCVVEGIIQSTLEGGSLTVVGIQTNDWNLILGSGHAEFEKCPDGKAPTTPVPILDFVEKPDMELARQLKAAGNNAVNTGINIFSAAYVVKCCAAVDLDELGPKGGLDTRPFMDMIARKYIIVGSFVWLDCGTATSVYHACKATPHHRNVSICEGKSIVERKECINSLFWTCPETDIYGVGCEDICVVAERIYDDIVIMLIKHEFAQHVKDLLRVIREDKEKRNMIQLKIAPDEEGKLVATESDEGNVLTNGNVKGQVYAYYVGVDHYCVTPIRTNNGRLAVCVERNNG